MKSFILATVGVFSLFGQTVLEKDWIGYFQVKEVSANPLILEVSGASNHSALGVSKIKTEQNGNSINILIYLAQGKSGKFEYRLQVPPDVTKVTLGNQKVTIWARAN